MAKRKVRSGIGLEFTGDRINVVKLTRTPEGVVLASARSVKFPPGKKEDDKKILVSNIIKAFEGLDFAKDEISLGVGGHMSFVRKVKLPPVSKSKLKQVVSFEVQQQVPFSLDEVIWDHQIISPVSKIPGPVVVLMAAIKQSFVEDLLKVMQGSINKIPDVVDISSLAIHNCLIFNDLLPKEKIGILVNLGFSYTDVSVENKGEIAFTRAVPIGRKNLLKKIADSRRVEMEQAEKILESPARQDLAGGEDISHLILPVWEDLVAEIKRTTNYYSSQIEKVTHFQYIYLSGELPKNSTLPNLLKDSFGGEIKEIDPLKKIGYNPAQLTDSASSLCVSIGLALRALEYSPVEVNLLPPRILSKRKLARKRPYFISSFVVLFLVGWVLLVLGTRSYNLTNEKINKVEPILKNYNPYVSKAGELKNKRQEITSKLQNIEKILKQKSRLSDILLEISKLTPSSIYITEISTGTASKTEGMPTAVERTIPAIEGGSSVTGGRNARMGMEEESGQVPSNEEVRGSPIATSIQPQTTASNRISLSGITNSYPTVGEYIKQLRTSPLFKTVDLVSASSVLEGESGVRTTQPRTESLGRTSGRGGGRLPAERTRSLPQEEGEGTIQKEDVQFTLEIVLDPLRDLSLTGLGQ